MCLSATSRTAACQVPLSTFSQGLVKFMFIESARLSNHLPGGAVVKNPPASAGDMGSIPGSGRTPGEENGSPLQYSCLQNPMDGETWKAIVRGVAESDMT